VEETVRGRFEVLSFNSLTETNDIHAQFHSVRYPRQDTNFTQPEYRSEVLQIRPACSLCIFAYRSTAGSVGNCKPIFQIQVLWKKPEDDLL